jgi:hypothetical protein
MNRGWLQGTGSQIGSGQRNLALMKHSEGKGCLSKNCSVYHFLLTHAAGQSSGNASDRDTLVRWSPPRVLGEPILPIPTMMGTYRAWGVRGRSHAPLSFLKWKHLDILPAPMRRPGAAQRSAGDIDPPHRADHDRCARCHRRARQEMADRADASGAMAFGFWPQALLPVGAGLAICLVGEVNRPLRERRLLADLTQPQAGPRWAA